MKIYIEINKLLFVVGQTKPTAPDPIRTLKLRGLSLPHNFFSNFLKNKYFTQNLESFFSFSSFHFNI